MAVNKEKVESSEMLYRVVKRVRPDCITNNGGISPALFKDSEGVSVDRDGERSEKEIISFIANNTFKNRAKAITKILAGFCFDIGADVKPAPSDRDPYHANIFLDSDIKKQMLQAKMLADKCKIVFHDASMKWTN